MESDVFKILGLKEETAGQYLKRKGVKLPKGATSNDVYKLYCAERDKESKS